MAAQKVLDKLHKNGIQYAVLHHKDYGEVRSAQDFAQLSKIPIGKVAKSLLLKDREQYVMAVLPAAEKADMPAIAQLSGVKNLRVAPLDELTKVTGFERFATAAVGLDIPVVVHEGLLNCDKIYVATGESGEELEIAPKDLVAVTNAIVW